MSSIAAIHVAKKQLGLDEDTYRAKLQLIVGKTSTKDMTEAEREMVIQKFREEGFAPAGAARRPNGKAKLSGKYAKKLQALWIAGYNLGIVRDRDDAALVAFIKRQTGIEQERWLRFPDDAHKVIEAMKGWIAREAKVDWRADRFMPKYTQVDGYRIAIAQWNILWTSSTGFWPAVTDLVDEDELHRTLTDSQWITVMNALGKLVRQAKGIA